MFSWLRGLFVGDSASHTSPTPITAGSKPANARTVGASDGFIDKGIVGRPLSYHPDLIPKLQSDHRALLDIYGQIAKCATAKDWERIANLLVHFRSNLQDHLLDEAVRLYVYLQKSIEDDESRLLIRSFRTEMEGIGRVVLKMLDRFEGIATSQYLQLLFDAEWRTIGSVLGDRIAREEKTLYPLYV